MRGNESTASWRLRPSRRGTTDYWCNSIRIYTSSKLWEYILLLFPWKKKTFRVRFTSSEKKKKNSKYPPKEMSKMHMREATLADIPRLAEIWSIAFLKDAFYDTIFPHRSEFLVDYRNMWTRKLQGRFLQLGERYLVVETDVVDTNGQSRKEITGWASWKRMGSSKAAEKIVADGECILRGMYKTSIPPRRTELMILYRI